MRLTEGSQGSRILAFGGYQPPNVLTNETLAGTVETSDEWIRSRVGIESRRLASPDESVADMAVAAGGKALAASGLSAADIDLVTVATCTPEVMIPNTAAIVATRLGITAPGAYDLNAACAGFCYALGTASDAVRAGSARNVLVIGAEKLSQWVDWTDRSTCIIFADGAEAGVDPASLAAFVPHQANLRIVEAIARKLGAPQALVADDIVHAGNTSSASIPLALSRMIERGQLSSGDAVLLLGFGAGVSYAAQVIKV